MPKFIKLTLILGGAGLKVKAQHIQSLKQIKSHINMKLTLGGEKVKVEVSNVIKCPGKTAQYVI